MTKPDKPDKNARKGPTDAPPPGDQSPSGRPNLPPLEVVEPMGKRVLIRKDEDRKTTKSGIHLPDKIEIPTITGRIVAISAQVDRDIDYPIARYDRVLFNPKNAIPVDLDADNRLYVIPVEDVVAVIRREAVG
jgi:chaperonin GroES